MMIEVPAPPPEQIDLEQNQQQQQLGEQAPAIDGFLQELVAPLPAPILQDFPELPPPMPLEEEHPRRSARLMKKTTTKMTPVQRAQKVLIQKLQASRAEPAAPAKKEETFLDMLKTPLPPNAAVAIGELLEVNGGL